MSTIDALQRTGSLTTSERVVASYILNHPEETSRISARELARRTYTSPTTVLRLSKKLGFASFNDLKVNIVSDLKRLPVHDTSIHASDNALAVMNKIAQLKKSVVERMREKTSPELLQQAADLIVSATYVDIFARDTPASAADYASHQFLTEGHIANVYEDLDRMVYLSMVMPPDHICLVMSRSGTDQTLMHVVQNIQQRGAKTIALTANRTSPLARMCDISFELLFSQDSHRLGNILFATAAGYLFDMLFALVLSASYDDVVGLVDSYNRLYYDKLDRARDRGKRTSDAPYAVDDL